MIRILTGVVGVGACIFIALSGVATVVLILVLIAAVPLILLLAWGIRRSRG